MPPAGGRFDVPRTLFGKSVLLDTGAFIALARGADTNHSAAEECLKAIDAKRLPLFVATPTIYETHRRFLYDMGRTVASTFLVRVNDGSVNIVRTTVEDEAEARILITRYYALNLTLTDAVNMAVMLRLKIAACFSFDIHFLQAGFVRIPPFHL